MRGQAERADPAQHLLRQVLERLAAVDVVLQADAVERHAARLEVARQRLRRVEAGARRVGAELVQVELRGRVGSPCRRERLLDPVRADHPPPDAVAHRAVGLDRLVDDVPTRDLTLPVAHHRADVVLHHGQQRRARPAPLHDPRGRPLVRAPDQVVAMDLLPVRPRPRDHGVRGGEVVAAARRLELEHLHRALGGEGVVAQQRVAIRLATAGEAVVVDRGPDLDRARRGRRRAGDEQYQERRQQPHRTAR